MTCVDTLLSNNDVISFLLENPLSNDYLLLIERSSQINSKKLSFEPVSLIKAIDIIRNKPDMADHVVWSIISQKRRGSSDSFLELIDLLQSEHQDASALVLNTYALSVTQICGDLYATEIELLLQWTDASSVFSIVQDIIGSKYDTCWTSRFCKAVCNFFWKVAKNSKPAEKVEFVNTGLRYAIDLQTKDPTSEWGYYWEVRLLWLVSPEEAAKRLRRYVVLAQPPPLINHIDDSKGELCCPRCCQMYIKGVLSRNTLSLHQIEQVANKGYCDARMMENQELTPKEMVEVATLCDYFNSKIEWIKSFQAKTSALLKNPPHEIPFVEKSRKNFIERQGKYTNKLIEED